MFETFSSIFGILFSLAQFALQILCLGISIEMLRLVYFSFRFDRKRPLVQDSILNPASLPFVTIQIPVCNDGHVLNVTLRALARLDYPHSRLEIQILDDSEPALTAIVNSTHQFWSETLPVVLLRRERRRKGAKAGNLNYGLQFAKGVYLFVIDVDAIPAANFVMEAVKKLEFDPELAMVQGSWTFKNREQNRLTRIQALLYDAIAQVQQSTRSNLGEPFHFHGSGALWRKTALLALGGWSENCLGEDLELSVSAKLARWKFMHLSELKVTIELVPEFRTYLVQQERWVMGQIQVLGRYAFKLFSKKISAKARLLILGHLSHPLLHPLLLLFMMGQALRAGHLIVLVSPFPHGVGIGILALSLCSLFLFIWRGAVLSERPRFETLKDFPFLILRYFLTAIFQSLAIVKYAITRELDFRLTPKS